jgi:hypothetical protein
MDEGEINSNPEDINRLSDREKRELQHFLQGESQKASVQKRMFIPLRSFAVVIIFAVRVLHNSNVDDSILCRNP